MIANPYMTAKRASEALGSTIAGAKYVINQLASVGILTHASTVRRAKVYVADEILATLD